MVLPTDSKKKKCNLMGGTGVSPVKFGVPPNFLERVWLLMRCSILKIPALSTVSGETPETTGRRPVPPIFSAKEVAVRKFGIEKLGKERRV